MRSSIQNVAAVWIALFASSGEGHMMRSAYVEVLESAPGDALVCVHAQVPFTGLTLKTEEPCTLTPTSGGLEALRCPATVAGVSFRIEGLGPLVSEAVVWTRLRDGTSSSFLLTPSRPSLFLPRVDVSPIAVMRQYIGLGFTHILTGFDHLLFLLALVAALRRVRGVLLAETAFTLSHSISFTAAALGWVHVPTAAVEACIALSLVLVAIESTRRGRLAAPPRAGLDGAGLAFVFGLVHGLGFAGGLAEIGLPPRAIPSALLGFAGGVEGGQVCFLALVLGLLALARRVACPALEQRLVVAATYVVGSIGVFWLLERLPSLRFFPT